MNLFIARTLAVLGLVLSTALSLVPAHAVEADPNCADPESYDNQVALCTPLHYTGTVLVIQGSQRDWSLRETAARLDGDIPGIRVSDAPIPGRNNVTITVRRYNSGPDGMAGYVQQTSETSFDLYLNDYAQSMTRAARRTTAAHELGHVLGFNHHDGKPGVMTSPQRLSLAPDFNRAEWGHICAWYGCSADAVERHW